MHPQAPIHIVPIETTQIWVAASLEVAYTGRHGLHCWAPRMDVCLAVEGL